MNRYFRKGWENMQLNRNMTNIICDLEYLIGSKCCNTNSYGEEMTSYKYPVKYYANKNDYLSKDISKTDRVKEISPKYISTMKYTFGSNSLYIGAGIVDILEYLEDRYELNFNELENSRHNIKVTELQQMYERLLAGEEIYVSRGRSVAGEDIPIGKYYFGVGCGGFSSTIEYKSKSGYHSKLFIHSNQFIELKEGYTYYFKTDYLISIKAFNY